MEDDLERAFNEWQIEEQYYKKTVVKKKIMNLMVWLCYIIIEHIKKKDQEQNKIIDLDELD